jgi:hypothetical protein
MIMAMHHFRVGLLDLSARSDMLAIGSHYFIPGGATPPSWCLYNSLAIYLL